MREMKSVEEDADGEEMEEIMVVVIRSTWEVKSWEDKRAKRA